MPSIGGTELLIILAVIALLFGASRLPKLARAVGQSSKEFRKGLAEGAVDEDEAEPKKKAKEKGGEKAEAEAASND